MSQNLTQQPFKYKKARTFLLAIVSVIVLKIARRFFRFRVLKRMPEQ
jgi:hypothetical protein